MFPILFAFDSVFLFKRLASYAPQLHIANEELCLCLLLFFSQHSVTASQPHSPLLLPAHVMCPSGDPKTALHNLYGGDLLCLHLFPTETVINLHWLSHQAHSTCVPAHLNPIEETTRNTRRTAVSLMTVALFSSFSQLIFCFYFKRLGICLDKNTSTREWELCRTNTHTHTHATHALIQRALLAIILSYLCKAS